MDGATPYLPFTQFFQTFHASEFAQPSVRTSSVCLNNLGHQGIPPVHLCILDPCFSEDRHPWVASFITAYLCTAQNRKGKEIQALIFTYAQGVHRVERKALSPSAVLSFSCLWVFQNFYLIYYISCLAKFISASP